MAVGTEVVAVRYEDIVAGTPISVPYPVYEALDILVYYGAASLQAVFNTDYTVSLAEDFDTFTLTPTASLLTKINNLIAANPADEVNYITVRRRLDYLTDSTAAAVRYTPFTSREFERTVLRFQQIQEQLNRCISLTPNFVGDEPRIQIAELVANRVLMADATGTNVIAGPTAQEVEDAGQHAEDALAYKTAAEQAAAAAAFFLQDTRDEPFDLSHYFKAHGRNIVITGDSLSYNAYDMPGGTANGPNAYDCYPGLMSWSFMLRDLIHRTDAAFETADNLDLVANASGTGASIKAPNSAAYVTPFASHYVSFGGTGATSRVEFMHRFNFDDSDARAVIHWFNNPNASAGGGLDGKCDVYILPYPYTTPVLAGTLTNDNTTLWGGFEPRQLSIDLSAVDSGARAYPIKVYFTNFRTTAGGVPASERIFFISGVGSKLSNVKLTGRGSWTAQDILADYANRIGNHSPDLLVMIIGANDRYYLTKEAHVAALETIIQNVKAAKPYAQIVILTTPRASDTGYGRDEIRNGSTMQDWLDAQRELVTSYGGYWFDTYSLTEAINPSFWRHDNVHFTRRGNQILFDALVSRYFAGARDENFRLADYDPEKVVGSAPEGIGNRNAFSQKRRPQARGSATLTYNTSNVWVLSDVVDPDVALNTVTRIDNYTVRINFNYGLLGNAWRAPGMGTPQLVHMTGAAISLVTRFKSITNEYVEFYFIKLDDTLPTDAEMQNKVFKLMW